METKDDLLEHVRTERRRSLLRSLSLLRDEDCLTDVRLIVANHVFPAHRLLLAANSLYFREVFESKPNINKITIGDVDVDVFNTVLNYLYTGQLTGPASQDLSKMHALLSAFKSLRIVNYQKVMGEVVLNNLSIDTFYKLWTVTKSIDQKPLVQEIVQFVAANIELCSQSDEFLHLTLAQMISIMACACIRNLPSDVILKVVSVWVNGELEKRKKYIRSVLSIVGLQAYVKKCEALIYEAIPKPPSTSTTSSVSAKCVRNGAHMTLLKENSPQQAQKRMVSSAPTSTTIIKTSLSSHPLSQSYSAETYRKLNLRAVRDEDESIEQFWESGPINANSPNDSLTESCYYSFHNLGTCSNDDDLDVLPVRQPAELNSPPTDHTCIVCVGQDDISLPVQTFYDLKRKEWMPLEVTIRVIGDNVTTLLHKRSLYYFGGELPGHEPLNTVHVHMLDNHTLTQVASMSVARSSAGAVYCAGRIYVVGGLTSHSELSGAVERYDPEGDSWQTLPKLLYARCNPSVASNYLGVYVVSGFLDEYNVKVCFSCECYSLLNEQWSEISSMPTGICALPTGIKAIDDDIYLIRLMKPNKIYQYDRGHDEWRMVCQCSSNEIQVIAMLNVDGWLWIVDNKQQVFKFDFETEQWALVTQVPGAIYPPISAFVLQHSI